MNKQNHLASEEIRESMLVFPAFTQPFFSWMTGKALRNQKPLIHMKQPVYLVLNLALYAFCLGANIWLVTERPAGWWLILPLAWILTVSSARIASTVVAHHCIHGQMTRHFKIDYFIAQFISTLLITEDAKSYFMSHITLHHKRGKFATIEDPTIKHLLFLGFKPSMTVKQLWMHLARMILSPKFHLHFALKRLNMNLIRPSIRRRLLSLAFIASSSALAFRFLSLETFVLAYLIPMWPLYHTSALIEFLTEHAWFKRINNDKADKSFHVSHSWGRFCGEKVPDASLPFFLKTIAWARWFFLMSFYHLPCRVFVVPGDLSQHDYHHRFPASKGWVIATYARQADIDQNHPGWPPYVDVWGIHNAINHVFAILASEDRIEIQES